VRLHRNQGRYDGETMNFSEWLRSVREAASDRFWRVETLAMQGGDPVLRLTRPAARRVAEPRRVYLSAGLHGDEPAGPLANLELIRRDQWPSDTDLFLFPCLNPGGMRRNTREDPGGVDLNRDYREPTTLLVRAHVDWMRTQPGFDLALLLHEDWEADGFYLYELCRQPARSRAEAIVGQVAGVCPILRARQADGWPAEGGIVRPHANPAERREWPEALRLFMEHTDLCYTLEAPSDYNLSTRVAALLAGVDAALG